jgi:DNA-binding MarR family transcriptional regulator
MKRVKSRRAVATETWRLMSEFTMTTFTSRSGVLQQMGLTPGHLKALRYLAADDAQPMGACAQAIGCDASTATWLVDRLEERGLVERRPSTTDRRVKGVVLTPFGAETKAKLEAHFGEPPESLLALDADALEALHDALSRLAEERQNRS